MLKKDQIPKFFSLQHKAWLIHSRRFGLDQTDKDLERQWRYSETKKVCGKTSVKELNPLRDFDETMLHWATISNDDNALKYFAEAIERRTKYCLSKVMEELSSLEDCIVDWGYVRAILFRMGLPTELKDCPASLLRKALQAIDTHVRRLKNRKNISQDIANIPF